METDKQIYILVLYERIGNSEPLYRLNKGISRELFASLINYKQTSVEVNKTNWAIMERLHFKTPILDTMYYYVSLICEKI